jgi:FKBP-type peptidyl-prolyl cis-trans isomerase SlyD
MKIQNGCVVAIDYTLKADDGSLLDTSEGDEPLQYLHGSGQIVPGLENALLGKGAGDKLAVAVKPEDGYGVRRNDRVLTVPRSTLPEGPDPEVGMQLEAVGKKGEHIILWITEVGAETVTLDGNHPLAGQTLHFDVEVREVREASKEELEHGHAHGPDGHHHHGPDHDHHHH